MAESVPKIWTTNNSQRKIILDIIFHVSEINKP